MNQTAVPVPPDMAAYLRAMVSPEHRVEDCQYLHITDPDSYFWAEHSDESIHGMTVESSSVEGIKEWVGEALRVLKPGAHLMLVAPDEEPAGYTGACHAEDAGFEVRDAILWVYGEGSGDKVHYVAKAARAEREAGCAALPAREVVLEEDGEAEATDVVSKVKNFHPTVKSVGIMTRLLADVPLDVGTVVDPFMGSGTTMVACVITGHDGIGIEMDPEYFPIADARVHHWDSASAAWDACTIVSDLDGKRASDSAIEEVDASDFLGL